MKTVRHRSRSGFTLVGLMVSISITAIVALGAAYIIISSQKVNSFGNAQNEIDRIQYLNLQLSRNPAFICDD
jgi:type II secretory pathway component PulJ